MIHRHALRPVLLMLLCITVLVARVSGAHLHFCLDGSEPRASLHVMDVVDNHPPGIDAPHHDFDVLLGEQTLAKYGKSSLLDLPVFLIAALSLLLLLQPRRRELFVPLVLAPLRASSYLRPPSCGPPALFSH